MPWSKKMPWQAGYQSQMNEQGNPTPYDPRPGGDLEGWEARRQGEIDIALGRYLAPFQEGGSYGPERLLSLFQSQISNQGLGGPARAVSAGFGLPYASMAQDVAGRAAGFQTANAMRGIQGLNPAAQAAAATQIAQGQAGNVAQAGLQGLQAGWGFGQQANLADLQRRMQMLGIQSDLFGGAVNRAFQTGATGAGEHMGSIQKYWDIRREDAARRAQAWQGALNSLIGAGGRLGAAALMPGSSMAMPTGADVNPAGSGAPWWQKWPV